MNKKQILGVQNYSFRIIYTQPAEVKFSIKQENVSEDADDEYEVDDDYGPVEIPEMIHE